MPWPLLREPRLQPMGASLRHAAVIVVVVGALYAGALFGLKAVNAGPTAMLIAIMLITVAGGLAAGRIDDHP